MVKNDRGFQIILHVIMLVLVILVLLPLVLLIMSSLTSESEIIRHGYALWPKVFDFSAYQYIFGEGSIFNAYFITIIVTIIGTLVSLVITTMVSYTLTVPGLPGKRLMASYPVYDVVFRRTCTKLYDVVQYVLC